MEREGCVAVAVDGAFLFCLCVMSFGLNLTFSFFITHGLSFSLTRRSLSLSLTLPHPQVVYPLLGASSRGDRADQTYGFPGTAGPAPSSSELSAPLPTSTCETSMCSLFVPPTSWPARRVSRVQYLMS